MCVMDLDHHCPFVGTCVGPRNRRLFVLFTLFASATCLLAFIAGYLPAQLAYCENKSFMSTQHCYLVRYPAVFASMWANLLVAIWVGSLFYSQLVLVASETTTYNSLQGDSFYIAARIGADPIKSLRHIYVFLMTGKHVVSPVEKGKEGGCCNHSDGSAHSHEHDHGHEDLEQGRAHSH